MKQVLFIMLSISLNATIPQENTIVLQSRRAGMFSVFSDVISLVQLYEKGRFSGAKVDFSSTGLYFDEKKGLNWWSYYFDPISLGQIKETPKIYNNLESWRVEFCNSRIQNWYLINKYIHLKRSLKLEIESIKDYLFEDYYVLGIHYRGGDKVSPGTAEAERVPYETVASSTRSFLKSIESQRYKIFIASDELSFIKYMISQFPGKIVYHKPAHNSVRSSSEIGKFAIIDAILLSKTNFLIRTNSNLSLTSLFFNPNLPYLDLSSGFWHPVKMMKKILDLKLNLGIMRYEIFYKSLENYLLNNGENILILGSSRYKNIFEELLRETPQKVIQKAVCNSAEPLPFSQADLIYIAPTENSMNFQEKSVAFLNQMILICERNHINKDGLIVIDNEEYEAFKELALGYLLLNGFDYFKNHYLILQKKH